MRSRLNPRFLPSIFKASKAERRRLIWGEPKICGVAWRDFSAQLAL